MIAEIPGAPFLDITSPDFDFTSAEVADAREKKACANTPLGTMIIRYDAVQKLQHDSRMMKDHHRYLTLQGITDGPLVDWWSSIITNRKGEDHARLRRFLAAAFSPRNVERLRPDIRSIVERLADVIEASETCEFMSVYANELAEHTLWRLIGVPSEDFEKFSRWTTDIALVQNMGVGKFRDRIEAALAAMTSYVDELIDRRKVDPGEDLISNLLEAQTGGVLTLKELRELVIAVLGAGHDTTRQTLGLGMQAFCENPEQWSVLADRPELASGATDEVLRYYPALSVQFRWAGTDIEVDDMVIPQGAFVLPSPQSAHRDPRAFEKPDHFDVAAPRSNPVLSFGAGPHYCIGAALSRIEIEETLSVLPQRLRPPTIAAPGSWRPPFGLRGPESLYIQFR